MISLEAHLRARRAAGHKLLVPYVTGGLDGWLDVTRAIADAGADAVEIGIPFSDPVMDGVTIQEASQRALAGGATPAGIIDEAAALDVGIPLAVMTYTNPVGHMGFRRFAAALVASGISGAIVPDLPLDELDGWGDAADAAGVETVLLAAPTTTDDRLQAICERSHGFVYGVSLMGVTGERAALASQAREMGRALQGGHRQAGPAGGRDLHRRAGGRSVAALRRCGRRQRAHRAVAAGRRAGGRARAGRRVPRGTRRMIKYIGSKRRLVPALARIAAAADARTALDLFTGTTRVAQAFKAAGATVTAVDTARYAEMFARCYIATDASGVDARELDDAIRELDALPGEPGYFTDTFCVQSRFVQPFNGARVDAIRDAIARDYAGSALEPILLTSLIEATDRVDSTTGLQMAYVKQWAPRSGVPLVLRVPDLLAGAGHAVRADAVEICADAG